ncbi:MAG: hypothetical protein E6J81_12720, partial [Deltaproteobacteria bacterium]
MGDPRGDSGRRARGDRPEARQDAGRDDTRARPLTSAMAGRSAYTCPMHPQVEEPGPGPCALCGMAL